MTFVDLAAQFFLGGHGRPTSSPVRLGRAVVSWFPRTEGKSFCNCVKPRTVLRGSQQETSISGTVTRRRRLMGSRNVPEEWKSMLLTRPIPRQDHRGEGGRAGRGFDFGGRERGRGREWGYGSAPRAAGPRVVQVDAKACLIEVHRDERWAKVGRERLVEEARGRLTGACPSP